MYSPEISRSQEPQSSKSDSPKPESHLTLNELSPEVKPLAVNVSKQILVLCRKHGIEVPMDASKGDMNLSQAVSDAVEKFIQKLSTDASLRQDMKHLLDLQQFLTSLHEQNAIPTDSKFVSTTQEEALREGVLYYKGNLFFDGITSAIGLFLPKIVNGGLYLHDLTSAEGLTLPEIVEIDLLLNKLTSIKGLIFPKTVGSNLELTHLLVAEGVHFPEFVGGNVFLNALKTAKDLYFPKFVGDSLILGHVTSAEGLHLPETVGMDLDLNNLTSVTGLRLPETIGGDLYLAFLPSVKGLVIPKTIGGRFYLNSLNPSEKRRLRKQYPHLNIV